MLELVQNFYNTFNNKEIFCCASDDQIRNLSDLFGKKVNKIIDFYRQYQPNNIPMLDSYVKLLDIDNIIMENTVAEPGRYLAEYGVYVFALTVGGNVLCIDSNECTDDDASILIADSNFCTYNEFYKCVEIGDIPDELVDNLMKEGIVRLNYLNIKKCLKKIESSFFTFMKKLSKNEYGDIEDYLN